jgi:hypothetical protein
MSNWSKNQFHGSDMLLYGDDRKAVIHLILSGEKVKTWPGAES